jgi:hypothetical protein
MIILFNRFRISTDDFQELFPLFAYIFAFKEKTKDIAAIGAKTNRFHNTYL